MDVFISWSGERSFKVATALKEWLPVVIQSVTPWFSAEDIDKGARWMAELSKQLDKQKMGIICVTPENMQAPWLLFEAGALSKVLDTSLVCPFLFGLEPTDLQGPLAQFQATRAKREDVRKLLSTINKNAASQLGEPQIDKLFSSLWSDLDQKLTSIESGVSIPLSRARPVPELLSEVLERVRSIERQLAESAIREEINDDRLRYVEYARYAEKMAYITTQINEIEKGLSKACAQRHELESMNLEDPKSDESEIKRRLEEINNAEKKMRMIYEQLIAERDTLAHRIDTKDMKPVRGGFGVGTKISKRIA